MTVTNTRTPDAGTRSRRTTGLIVVLAASGVVVSLMQSLIIPLVPELPRLLGASATGTSWAITATLLAAAVATPTVGRLGDMLGKRRMLLISLAVLVAGSVIGALSTALAPLIVARTLQGLAAGVVPLGISILRDELPPARLGGGAAVMSASLGVGGALGLPIAAVIAQSFDWHVLFVVAAVLGVVAFALVARLVPPSPTRTGGRFDLVGALTLAGALTGLLLAVTQGAGWGWTSPATLAVAAGAILLLSGWVLWERRTPQPLVDLRLALRRGLLLTNCASLVFGFAIFAMSLVLPRLLQLPVSTGYGLGASLLTVGLVMAPSGLITMALSPLSAWISRTRSPKTALVLGALVVAAGYGLGIVLLDAVWQLVLVSSIIGAGVGLAYGAIPALVMSAVPVAQTAAANGLNTLMRSIGTSISSAVAGVVLAQLVMPAGGTTVPTLGAVRLVLGIAAAAGLLALVIAACIPRRAVGPDAAGARS